MQALGLNATKLAPAALFAARSMAALLKSASVHAVRLYPIAHLPDCATVAVVTFPPLIVTVTCIVP